MKRLLLLGAGHAHIQVLKDLARQPMPGVQVTLVSPYLRQMYSGMVPGWIAGRYRLEECAIALSPLIHDSKVRWFHNKVVTLDVDARRVRLADGERLGFDVLSVDTGSVMDSARVRGATEHAILVRPIEDFAQRWLHLLDRVERGANLTLVIVGAGAAGVELCLAMAHRLGDRGRMVLVTGGEVPLHHHPIAARHAAAAALKRARVTVMRMPCLEVSAHHVHLAGDDAGRIDLPCDGAIICTGSQAPRWLPESGLELDPQGYIATGPTLQSVSHPEVFAVGDVATRTDVRHPKNGVYAVRAGPPLVQNLRRFFEGQSLVKHRPQRFALNLLACGDGSAIASWGPFAGRGGWAWRWKDRIDREFVGRYNRDPVPEDEANMNVMAGAIDPAADVARVAVASPMLLPGSAPPASLAALEPTIVLNPGANPRAAARAAARGETPPTLTAAVPPPPNMPGPEAAAQSPMAWSASGPVHPSAVAETQPLTLLSTPMRPAQDSVLGRLPEISVVAERG